MSENAKELFENRAEALFALESPESFARAVQSHFNLYKPEVLADLNQQEQGQLGQDRSFVLGELYTMIDKLLACGRGDLIEDYVCAFNSVAYGSRSNIHFDYVPWEKSQPQNMMDLMRLGSIIEATEAIIARNHSLTMIKLLGPANIPAQLLLCALHDDYDFIKSPAEAPGFPQYYGYAVWQKTVAQLKSLRMLEFFEGHFRLSPEGREVAKRLIEIGGVPEVIEPPKENHASFLGRFRLKLTKVGLGLLDIAYVLAKYGHRNQYRDGGVRYFEHCRATALIMVDELGITDVDMIIAALLHDMLEDSFLLTGKLILIIFGKRVAKLVRTVTKPRKTDARFKNATERNAWYFDVIAHADVFVKILKLADRLHNLRTLGECSKEKQAGKIKETKIIYLPLLDDVESVFPREGAILREQMTLALTALETNTDKEE